MSEIEDLKFQLAAEKKRVELCDAVIAKQKEERKIVRTASQYHDDCAIFSFLVAELVGIRNMAENAKQRRIYLRAKGALDRLLVWGEVAKEKEEHYPFSFVEEAGE